MTETRNTYLIVGGSSGIGKETARFLVAQGHRVVVTARRENKLKELVESLSGEGHRYYAFDASDEEAAKAFAKKLKKDGVSLDGVAFCVGRHSVKPLRVVKKGDFEAIMQSNVFAVTNLVPSLIKRMLNGGSIVLIGSAATIRAGTAVSTYVAAKSALEGLARSWGLELAPKNIRVNVVAPGVVTTEMTNEFFEQLGDEAVDEVKRRHPLGLGEPRDVAELVAFLLGGGSKWITGQTIVIDGGFSVSDR